MTIDTKVTPEMVLEGAKALCFASTYEGTGLPRERWDAAWDRLREGTKADRLVEAECVIRAALRAAVNELPPDLQAVLRDQSVVVPQDHAVWELIAKWRDAPSNTASAS